MIYQVLKIMFFYFTIRFLTMSTKLKPRAEKCIFHMLDYFSASSLFSQLTNAKYGRNVPQFYMLWNYHLVFIFLLTSKLKCWCYIMPVDPKFVNLVISDLLSSTNRTTIHRTSVSTQVVH